MCAESEDDEGGDFHGGDLRIFNRAKSRVQKIGCKRMNQLLQRVFFMSTLVDFTYHKCYIGMVLILTDILLYCN